MYAIRSYYGHGKSEGLGRQDISEYGKVVYEFMKALRLKSAVLVGFSMGSAIALSIALHRNNFV